ncbi:hypothetical protein Pcinc_037821 [Petrolisthes cinctipes]|uniref:Uncharacterized protein n=1 Tax=Petrolisthes cinctipes TaxID=88211 RepID=A0AAE1BS69_PETCI|nr:hypothetical protein Pcinc_037821 [Petrolisthes cinctipes]
MIGEKTLFYSLEKNLASNRALPGDYATKCHVTQAVVSTIDALGPGMMFVTLDSKQGGQSRELEGRQSWELKGRQSRELEGRQSRELGGRSEQGTRRKTEQGTRRKTEQGTRRQARAGN